MCVNSTLAPRGTSVHHRMRNRFRYSGQMTPEWVSDEQCPYCEPPYSNFTDDHIFPQFLGGRRVIRVCKRCNSAFGHSFEGRASQQLKRVQVFISHFGLDLSRNSGLWPSALAIEGAEYDLTSGPAGAQYRLSKPVIQRSPEGLVIGGKARSKSEANKIARGIVESGNAKEVEIWAEETPVLEDIKLDIAGTFDEDLFRFATKLSAAVLAAFGYRELIARSQIPSYLHEKTKWPTSVAFCDVEPLHKLKPPLAHTVYVELGQVSYSIVLIFGYMKLFVPLPRFPQARGMLASLDPITGEENFGDVDPIGPRAVPSVIQQSFANSHLRGMLDILADDAVNRGARKIPQLYVGALDLGAPMPEWWTNSTVRYMFPNFPVK